MIVRLLYVLLVFPLFSYYMMDGWMEAQQYFLPSLKTRKEKAATMSNTHKTRRQTGVCLSVYSKQYIHI